MAGSEKVGPEEAWSERAGSERAGFEKAGPEKVASPAELAEALDPSTRREATSPNTAAASRTRTKGRLANDAWESLLTAQARLLKPLADTDIWDDISMSDYDVLYTLVKMPGPVRQSNLTKHVLLSQPALSRLIDRLVARGLISRSPDPSDRRATLLGLTEAGSAVQRTVGARHAVDVARLVGGRLTVEEMIEMERLMRKLSRDEQGNS